MKKVENIKEFIEKTKELFEFPNHYIYSGVQMNVDRDNPKYIIDFLKFCEPLHEHLYIDALGGRKTKPSFTRERVDDRTFEDVIKQLNNKDVFCCSGLKIYHKSNFSIYDWESWEGGYIEIFLRTNAKTDPDYNELFIWMYIRIEHLETILKNAQEYICYFENPLLT